MSDLLRVLLVEDNPGDADLIIELLPKDGPTLFDVQCVARLAEALERVSTYRFDIILLDLGLPDSDGMDTLRTMRRRSARLPIVVLTGNNDERLALAAIQEGAQDYLVKGQMDENLFVRSIKYAIERKRTREALSESEEKYRGLFESSLDAIMIFEPPSWKFTSANPATLKMFGAKNEEEFISLGPCELSPDRQPDGRASDEKANEMIKTAMREGSHFFEWTHRRIGGEVFSADVLLTRMEQRGKVILQASVRDITARKRSEEGIINSRKLLQTIINTVPMRVFWKDTELRYLGCNLAFAAEAGAAQPDDLIGKDDYQLGWKEQTEKYRADDRSVIESGVPKLFYDEQQITPDGQMIWVRTSKVPLRNEADETIGILGIFNDITEYKQAEESLRESNERFTVAFNKAPMIFTICSLEDGTYLDVNQQFVDISGFSREEAIGKTPVELSLITRSDQEQRLYLIQRDGKIDEKELSLYTKSGKTVLCKYWSEIITVAGRKCLLNIYLDITENRKLEQQFIQAQKMELVGQLAGGVAHDFNNMLHVIIGHAEMALLKTDPSQPLFADLEQIRKSAYRSADLTRQLLAFARKQTILPKVLDLNETMAGMLKMLQRLIGEDISLIWRPAAKLWQIEVDPSQIDQIVANLCVNARDAISGVGKITIESANITLGENFCAHHPGFATGEYVRLTVSDDGCGMDKETLSHIFEPFFTTKGVGEGTGLGLATVFGAVKQNNGFIDASSELGAGTTFTIYLPRYVGIDVEARTEVTATPVLQGQETILLVEDEPGIIFVSTQMLEMLGYTVLAANSPDEAIRLAREYAGEIHLLLTDVIMPKMNGLDLAKNLLSTYPHMKLLFMSGYTNDVISQQCLLLEGGYFIQKPISMQDLAAKVREVLDSK